MTPKILLCCATRKGYEVLKAIIGKYPESLAAVCSFKEIYMQESFYDSIAHVAKAANIPFLDWQTLRDDSEHIVKKYKVDSIITISWKYFLPLTINRLLRNKIIIIHDSLLPKYSGFAPLATALINGEKQVGITVLYASEEIDAGKIISQKKIKVQSGEYIAEVIDRITELYNDAVLELISDLKGGRKLRAIEQNHSKRTFSIWRDPEDCQIDWNNSAQEIFNLVRAVGYPYTGAYSFLGNGRIRIWKSEIVKPDLKFEIRQPGKIWTIDKQGQPVVVCGQGLLKITEATSEGRSIIPVKVLRQRFNWQEK